MHVNGSRSLSLSLSLSRARARQKFRASRVTANLSPLPREVCAFTKTLQRVAITRRIFGLRRIGAQCVQFTEARALSRRCCARLAVARNAQHGAMQMLLAPSAFSLRARQRAAPLDARRTNTPLHRTAALNSCCARKGVESVWQARSLRPSGSRTREVMRSRGA